jgi:hypothetical protein
VKSVENEFNAFSILKNVRIIFQPACFILPRLAGPGNLTALFFPGRLILHLLVQKGFRGKYLLKTTLIAFTKISDR